MNDKDENGATSRRVVEERRIPIVEERIEIDRREKTGRTISVTTRPAVEEVRISEPVIREEVSVERVPVGKVVAKAPPIREEDDLTIVPVVEERIRVVTELVLVEEIHLRRSRRHVLHEETVTRRITDVKITGRPGE